jgi:hypothetical protein
MTTVNPQRRAMRVPDTTDTHEPARETTHPEAQGRARTRVRNSLGVTKPSHDSYINFDALPSDVSLNWKLYTCQGQEYPGYLQAMRGQGWEPVDPQEHPDWVKLPPGYDKHNVIIEGHILMERPMSLTKEAYEEMRFNAVEQVRTAEQRLGMTPNGTLTRDHEGTRPRVTREMMRPMPIED